MPTYRGYRPRLLWGTNFANALDVGYMLDNVRAGSRPRDGSEEIVLLSGVEDAFLAGEEHYLTGRLRWVPPEDTLASGSVRRASGWNGTTGWRAALHWMKARNIARLYPDNRNLLRSPAMGIDANANGVVDEWNYSAGTATSTVGFDSVDLAQTIDTTAGANPSNSDFYQDVPGILAGEALTASVRYKTTLMTNARPELHLAFYSGTIGAGVFISSSFTAGAASPGTYSTLSHTATAPANTSYVTMVLRSSVIGASPRLLMNWRQAALRRDGQTTYLDNPYWPVYLRAPWDGDHDLERNATRALDLRFVSADGSAFDGY